MRRKPIRIDWDALEQAFSNPVEESVAYLDRITGRIALEGEGEEDDLDDDGAAAAPLRGGSGVRREDPTRLEIRPPGTERKIGWLRAFLAGAAERHPAEVVAELEQGMASDNPAPVLRAIFQRHPEVREAWWVYRTEQVQQMIDAWLAEHDIEPAAPPPWRS
jgi:hypothetical protein